MKDQLSVELARYAMWMSDFITKSLKTQRIWCVGCERWFHDFIDRINIVPFFMND